MRLLAILGWTFAKEGKKFAPFGASVISLGVSLDLARIWKGQIQVANKPGRLAKIAELLKPIIAGEPRSKKSNGRSAGEPFQDRKLHYVFHRVNRGLVLMANAV